MLNDNLVKQPEDEKLNLTKVAEHYQNQTDARRDAWFCHQCRAWVWTVDLVGCPPFII